MTSPNVQNGVSAGASAGASDERRDLVIGCSPFGRPDAALVAALTRAGALGVLDLGGPRETALAQLSRLARWSPKPFGVRVSRSCDLLPADLDPFADVIGTVVFGTDLSGQPDSPWRAGALADRYGVLVEVTAAEHAVRAAQDRATGVIAVGFEAAGPVGELSAFVLLQQVLEAHTGLPVWVRGGIGTATAAACVVGGAAGVVLDTQLSLLAESDTAEQAATVGCRLDGESTVVAGYRVQVPPAARISAEELGAMSAEDVLAQMRAPRLAFTPLGQDGFLAEQFARRFGTVARAVRGIRSAAGAALDALAAPGSLPAAASDTLSSQSPLCSDLGLRRPVVQGPMTRVSDTPKFARAIADDGALPCVALALADRAATALLLGETRKLLGDRPWGVGLLGFAPEEVRTAQLEAIIEARPAAVVVAGGRPQQASQLESAGIPAFLHVPSPTLLRQYLDAGVRRFVFEGTECGGHVGPRASFPLWEAQLEVVTAFLDSAANGPTTNGGAGLQVLFAGGVHDARSAAMVATLAAGIAARGVAVGLLMGTSYLFTEEAVRTGAIQSRFQQQLIEATSTTLLQTAPGHLTRCVPSPFVDHFARTKRELRDRKLTGTAAWEVLEALNVGRLRIASKGVEREGDRLVTVDAARQLSEGLFMAGQVAALRRQATTVAALHDSVTVDAARFLAKARTAAAADPAAATATDRAAVTSEPAPCPVDVAIIGMACVLPKSPDLAAYWANIVAGVDAIEEVSHRRWDPEVFYRADLGRKPSGRHTPSKWGGFLPRIPFDPLRYGIPPSALASVEPVQFLALEVARRALEDARLAPSTFDRSRTAVVFGTETNSDLLNGITLRSTLPAYYGEVPPELDDLLPQVTEDTFPGILGNIIASRISNRLDLAGPAYVVDAACGSSLAALDMACKELVLGTSDTVLCGGADLHNGSLDFLLFSSVSALSPSGRARPFDASADGTSLAEGIACVVLKRLADAERDGDRIYAVVKAVAGASDGRSLGLTAPRAEGQYLALHRTYQRAGIRPAEIGLVEAHGTGTIVGDRTELESLTRAFSEGGAQPGTIQLGSVKSQIGHAKTAAGLAGLIKVALAIHHGVRPPTLHVQAPNPAWDAEASPFVFAGAARPWPVPRPQRAAAVSAFGFGGANYHAVVVGHADGPHRHALDEWPCELFLFCGTDRTAAGDAIDALRRLMAANDAAGRPWRLRDLARTAATWADAATAPVQVAVVAADLDELAAAIDAATRGEESPERGVRFAPAPTAGSGATERLVAVLFPGQGSQRPGMLADLFVAFPELQEYLRLGAQWADLIHPPTAFTRERADAARAALTDTRVAQPALGIASLACHHLLDRLGIRPDMVGGHSYGELVALAVAGAYDPETLLRLSAARGAAVVAAAAASGDDPGTMAAVRAPAEQVAEVLAAADLTDRVAIANHNAPAQVVVSGTTAGVAAAVRALAAAGHTTTALPVACAFHSRLIASAVERFSADLTGEAIAVPRLPVFANRTAAPYPADPHGVRDELARQVGAPVRFVEQIEAMYAAGARVFVEAGPGRVLTGLVGEILGDREHTVVALDGGHRGLRGLLDSLAMLAVAGVVPRTRWLLRGRDAADLTGAVPPRRPGWCVDGRAVVTADGEPLRGGLAPARIVSRPVPVPDGPGTGSVDRSLADDRRDLVTEFLRTSRDMLAQQREVLMTYLGAQPPQSALPAAPSSDGGRHGNGHRAAGLTTPAAGPAIPADGRRADNGRPAGAAGTTAPAAAAAAGGSQPDIGRTVVAVIGESTGYPADMIEPDLDLETDLSIDSIKRTEIAGVLIRRLGDDHHLDGGVDALTRLRTVRAITDWISQRLGTAATPQPAPASAPPTTAAPQASTPRLGRAPRRYVVGYEPAPLPALTGQAPLAGHRVVLLGDGDAPEVAHIARRLRALGAEIPATDDSATGAPAPDAVVYLGGWRPGADGQALPEGYETIRSVVLGGTPVLLGVVPLADPGGTARPAAMPAAGAAPQRHVTERAAGLRGLLRCVAREYPDRVTRMVEVDRAAVDSAEAVAAELATALSPTPAGERDCPVFQHAADGRRVARILPAPLGHLAASGAGPAGTGSAEVAAMGLDPGSVVLLIGGARGITAGFTTLLAEVAGCRLELVGRSPRPAAAEDPATAGAHDEQQLRQAVIGTGVRIPREVERAVGRIMAEREVRATLADIAARGGTARYHQADVLDSGALLKIIERIVAEHGRLDGVVYAAGVIADQLLADKDTASFRKVFNTKVEGALSLLAALADLTVRPRFVVLFGSIAGVAGNRGQADYAAANDALETLGSAWAERTGVRTLTVHWGPWAPSDAHRGMVGPGLRQAFADRGIELIDQEEGHLALLRELAWGSPAQRAVVYTASGWVDDPHGHVRDGREEADSR